MSRETFRVKVERVEALALLDESALLGGLAKALLDRSNYVVAKAAAVAARRYVIPAIPDLLAAYDRLFEPESDPLVLGKHAIASALKELDVRDPAPFIRGLQHVQLEPVWGGSEDHAGLLRSTCAHALVACDIDGVLRLHLLADHLVDGDRTVRRDVARAIANVGGHEAVLLLRLKTLTGDSDPEVVGECFSALVDLDPSSSVSFVERFLRSNDGDIAIEAVSALAGSRELRGLMAVRRLWETGISADLRRAIVFSRAASPLVPASEFLLSLVAGDDGNVAAWALSALGDSRFRNDVRERARIAVQRRTDARVAQAYVDAFESA
jgi:HEAT repeat protein